MSGLSGRGYWRNKGHRSSCTCADCVAERRVRSRRKAEQDQRARSLLSDAGVLPDPPDASALRARAEEDARAGREGRDRTLKEIESGRQRKQAEEDAGAKDEPRGTARSGSTHPTGCTCAACVRFRKQARQDQQRKKATGGEKRRSQKQGPARGAPKSRPSKPERGRQPARGARILKERRRRGRGKVLVIYPLGAIVIIAAMAALLYSIGYVRFTTDDGSLASLGVQFVTPTPGPTAEPSPPTPEPTPTFTPTPTQVPGRPATSWPPPPNTCRTFCGTGARGSPSRNWS